MRVILIGARAKASLPPPPNRFMGEEVVSTLTGLHYKTKLHSTEVDSVPTSQCKRNVVSVWEGSSKKDI
jgi:hypothetical protein